MFLTAVLGFCLFFYGLVAYLGPLSRARGIPGARRVLLVTAHPDDETMFFGPAVLNLRRQEGTEVFLLCLSSGDYRRRGAERKEELYRACQVLGIPEENITMLKCAI